MNPIFTGHIDKGKLILDQPYKYAVRIASLEGKKTVWLETTPSTADCLRLASPNC